MIRRTRAIRPLRLTLALLLTAPAFPAPVFAQSSAETVAELRLRKVEAEVSALQRKVFPGGDPKFFAPEVQPGQSAATPAPGTPATTAVSDILTRMDSLEAQIARLTAANEENTVRISRIETKLGIGAASPASAVAPPASTAAPAAPANLVPAPAPVPPKPAAASPAASGPSAKRLAAVKAIAKPKTDDPGDDEYSYGYRLWDAKFYPEAEQQLKMFLEKYPKHDRVSYARNLLGRALLDEGKPREAAQWFLQNYQAGKKGDRAPDSLLYLAESMKRLKDTTRACVALAQFRDDYPGEAATRLKAQLTETAHGLTCN